jgi:hypothetical protein
MLDLELLEKRLDDVLKQETSESLTSWIRKKREQRLYSFLGEGNLCKVSLQEFSIEVLDSESNSIEKIFSENNLIGLSTKINLAA